MIPTNIFKRYSILILNFFLFFQSIAQEAKNIVNDVTQLNPISVHTIIAPVSTEEIIDAVKTHEGPISIGGGRYSMGGQTATEHALYIDMRDFDSILYFSNANKEITVQAGITWREIQSFIDSFDLSIKIMQTYSNFTVGGSLSVNVHGRYIGQGPIVSSVKLLKIVLANGDVVQASPIQNKELFYGAIGGYGGLGVITEATLSLTENSKVERTDKILSTKEYKDFFLTTIRHDTMVVFHNADIYPNRYKKIRAITYTNTTRPVTVKERLKPVYQQYKFKRFVVKMISEFPSGKWLRQHCIDPLLFTGKPVEWRNYEASYDVLELEPKSRKNSTYVLQEYFVPEDQFDAFSLLMVAILKKNKANVMNVSVRHATKDPGSLLAWARTDVFSFVIYYKQGTKEKEKAIVKDWTLQLIEASVSCKGTYYLPYQIYATEEQFLRAYPMSSVFFMLKKHVDPTNKFRNKLWDHYYHE